MFKFFVLLLCLGATTSFPSAQKFKFVDSRKISPETVVRLGSSVLIDCETTDASAVVTLWKKQKGKEIEIQPSNNVIQNGQIFSMHNIALEDAGEYECKAQDSMNTKISKSVVIIINTNIPALVIRPSQKVTLTGSTVTFTCEAVFGKISWHHVPDTIQTKPKPSKYTVKETFNASFTRSVLTIPNAQVSNSGTYECWLYYGSKSYRMALLTVIDPKKPTFAHGNSQTEIKTVKSGHTEHLNCEANGFPKPTVSWEKDGNPIPVCRKMFLESCQSHNYLYRPRGIKIKSARFPQDNGTYTCVAKNSAGVSRKDFQVVVEVKPVLDKSKSLYMHGSTVTCRATAGNPPPKFSWSMQFYWFPMTKKPDEKRWSSLSKYGNTAVVSSDGMKSSIHVPSPISRAFYKCVAVNQAGSDSHVIKMMRMF